LLIKAYLKANGETLTLREAEGDVAKSSEAAPDNTHEQRRRAISIAELSRRFGIDESVLRKAEKDLEK
jgi:hypothetical protein